MNNITHAQALRLGFECFITATKEGLKMDQYRGHYKPEEGMYDAIQFYDKRDDFSVEQMQALSSIYRGSPLPAMEKLGISVNIDKVTKHSKRKELKKWSHSYRKYCLRHKTYEHYERHYDMLLEIVFNQGVGPEMTDG